MKKIIPILVVGILVLSGLGAFGIKSSNDKQVIKISNNTQPTSKDYTHTVFVEVGTATWCPSCPASNAAWHNIYGTGNYDFEYTEMVIDKNSKANARMNEYNLYWVPTSYFDGGQYVFAGTDENTFKSNLNSCGLRSVPDLDADLSAQWLGNAKIQIDLSIANNDNNNYPGKLRVHIIEKESTLWNDNSGKPYYHAFLDFAWNQVINIDSGDTFEDSKIWDGAAAGYGNIEPDNIQVILAVFDDTPHQAYSDPPSGAPFNAYYVDETVATDVSENQPPSKPTITGPTTGDPNVEYQFTFKATDNEEEDVYYWVDWGDETNSDWVGPYSSGANAIISHTYTNNGIYEIKAKAKDINNGESGWSNTHKTTIGNLGPNTPEISGPTSGKVRTALEYTFTATDPNEDNLYYFIRWGDGSTEDWFGPYTSGQEVKMSHSWKKEGNWIIEAKVKDISGLESDWARLEISIPRTRQSFNQLLTNILQRFPIINTLIENLLTN